MKNTFFISKRKNLDKQIFSGHMMIYILLKKKQMKILI